MGNLESLYRLQTFQLGRLNHALARRDRAVGQRALQLSDRSIASLYSSCIDVGVGAQARVLIDTYRRPLPSVVTR
ncbi:MAG: hypothetical protein ACRDIY_03485 [Chloroflexota bacterium]